MKVIYGLIAWVLDVQTFRRRWAYGHTTSGEEWPTGSPDDIAQSGQISIAGSGPHKYPSVPHL